VPIRHQSVVGHALATRKLYGLGAEDRVPQFASISFDIAVEEMFPTWSVGAELVLRPDDVLDVGEFTRWLDRRGITVLQLPTAYFQRWVDGLLSRGAALPDSLRMVVVGGETATLAAYERFVELAGSSVRWVNAYGPTEATVTATTFEAPPGAALRKNPPIGRPIPGVFAYVMGPSDDLVPIGVPGELFLGGGCLTPGYLGRPLLDRERFVDVRMPRSESPERLYRTGDRVRLLASGDIEYLGRDDRQVKLRGFRIELGEVEAALSSHRSVASAAARVSGDGASARLVGYVAGSPRPDAEAVRQHLASALPAHLVPSALIALDELPHLPNGKVDYGALPDPGDTVGRHVADRERPRTLVETMVRELWRETLGRQDIGIDDNFFALGGDSLQAIRMLDQTNRMGLDVDGAAFFHSPTVRGIAGGLTVPHALPDDGATSLVTLRARGTRPPLFFMHSTPGDLLGYGPLIYRLGEGQPCYGLQSRGLAEPATMHRTIEAMAMHYASLIRRFQAEGPYILVGWCFGGHLAVETARQLRANGGAVAPVVLVDAFPAFGSIGRASSYARRAARLVRSGPRRWVEVARARHAGGGPSGRLDEVFRVDVDAGAFANRPAVYRENLAAADMFRTTQYAGRALLIRCAESPGAVTERDYGWSRFIEHVEVFDVDAEHETLLKDPHATEVARFLKDWTDRVDADP